MSHLVTPERPGTPRVNVAATSSLYWELTIPPPFHVPQTRRPGLRSLALSADTYSEIRHDGPLRLSNEMTYYLVLQHYHQWRNAQDLCPWLHAIGPRSQEVMKYGLMHRFLHSLGPPPQGWVCPPPIATKRCHCHRHRRHRHRHCCRHKCREGAQAAQVRDKFGSPGQVGPSAEAGVAEGIGHARKGELPDETNPPIATESVDA